MISTQAETHESRVRPDGWHIGVLPPELTALVDPPWLHERAIRTYQAAGVKVLDILPLRTDHQAVIRELRKFTTTIR